MAFAGTRNAKALAWNSGSLKAEAQSHRDRMGVEEAGTRQGRQGMGDQQRVAPGESQGQRHRGTGAGAEQREVTEASGRTLGHFGRLRRKQMEPLAHNLLPFLLSTSSCTVTGHGHGSG